MVFQNRILTDIDWKQIVRIHQCAFENFFLTQLGFFFLKTYYRAVLKNENSIAVGCFDDKNLVGFAIGAIMSKGYHTKLLKENFSSFLLCGIYIIVAHPKALIRLKRNATKVANPRDDGIYAELLSIGIDPDYKGRGLGTELINGFEREVCKKNVRKITLTTDKKENQSVIDFYIKSGYSIFYSFMAYPHREMYKMIKEL